MKAPTQIQPPENWPDFEALCKKLWGEIWHCADTIKKMDVRDKSNMGLMFKEFLMTGLNITEYSIRIITPNVH